MRAFTLSTFSSIFQRTIIQSTLLQRLYSKAFPILVLLITVTHRAPEFPGGGTGR